VACRTVTRALEANAINTGILYVDGKRIDSGTIYRPDSGVEVQPDSGGILNVGGINGLQTIGIVPNSLALNNLRSITPFIVGTSAGDSAYTTVSSAITAAAADALFSGSTQLVWIKAGTYTGNITLSNNVHIVGGSGVVINGDVTVPAVGVGTPDMKLRNLSITGALAVGSNVEIYSVTVGGITTINSGTLRSLFSSLANIEYSDGNTGTLSTIETTTGTITNVNNSNVTIIASLSIFSDITVANATTITFTGSDCTFASVTLSTSGSNSASLQNCKMGVVTVTNIAIQAQNCQFDGLNVGVTVGPPPPILSYITDCIIGSPVAAPLGSPDTMSGFANVIWNAVICYSHILLQDNAVMKCSSGAILNINPSGDGLTRSLISVQNSARFDAQGLVVSQGVANYTGDALLFNGGSSSLVGCNIATVSANSASGLIVNNVASASLSVINSWVARVQTGGIGNAQHCIVNTGLDGSFISTNNVFFNSGDPNVGSSGVNSTTAFSSGLNTSFPSNAVGPTGIPVNSGAGTVTTIRSG
jgi:hypothetical protein